MIVLALDTCDSRGSLAILRDDQLLHVTTHNSTEDYSSWVLPATKAALAASSLKMQDIELFAVASGPGSFTGLRVGLTTVKAWSEVYGVRIAAVSRLEALGELVAAERVYAAAFVDAQREQVFGALYHRADGGLHLVEEKLVIAPEEFLEFVERHAAGEPVAWISLDPEKITALSGWSRHAQAGEHVQLVESVLAPVIGSIGRRRALEGRLKDALTLDADYVRRSDAEIFWKGGAKQSA